MFLQHNKMLFEYQPYTDQVPRLGKLETGKNFISLFFSHSQSPIVRQLFYKDDIYKVLVERNNIFVVTKNQIENITLDQANFEFNQEDINLSKPAYVLPRLELLSTLTDHGIPLEVLLTYDVFLRNGILYFSSKFIKPHTLYKYCDGCMETFDSKLICPGKCEGHAKLFEIFSSETYILEVIYSGKIQYLWCNNDIFEMLEGFPIVSKTGKRIGVYENGRTVIYDSQGVVLSKKVTLPFEAKFYTDDEIFYNGTVYSLLNGDKIETVQNIDSDTTGSYILTVTNKIIQNPLRDTVSVKLNDNFTIDYLAMVKSKDQEYLFTDEHKCAILKGDMSNPSSSVFGLCLTLPDKNFEYVIIDSPLVQAEVILAEQENMGILGLYQANNLTRHISERKIKPLANITELILTSKFLEAFDALIEIEYEIYTDLILNHITFDILEAEPVESLMKFFRLYYEVKQILEALDIILNNENTIVLTEKTELLKLFLEQHNFKKSEEADLFDFFF